MAIRSLLALLFLFVVVPPGLIVALAAPPGATPDEPAHAARAGSLLQGQILGLRARSVDHFGQPMINAGVISNAGPVIVTTEWLLGPSKTMTRESLARLGAIPWSDRAAFVLAPNTASYPPILYIPASFGLGLGHLLGYSPFVALLIARVCGLAAFAGLGACAILAAQRGHALLFATLTLPMTLWLGATLNQDGVFIAVVCLAAALLTRVERPQGWPYWTAGVLLALVIAVKPPYFLFAAAMLLPWHPRIPAQRAQVMAGLALVLLPAAIWTVLAQAAAPGIFIQGPPYHPGPLWPGDPATSFVAPNAQAQLQVFLNRPTLLVRLVLDTLPQEAGLRLNEMIGVLGPLTIVMPLLAYTGWKLALAAAILSGLFRERQGGTSPSWPGAAAVGVALIGTVFVIYDAQYLSWTPVGKPLIEGVQGRYFLPMLPMLAIALPVVARPRGPWISAALALPAMMLAAAGVAGVPLLLIQAYYLS